MTTRKRSKRTYAVRLERRQQIDSSATITVQADTPAEAEKLALSMAEKINARTWIAESPETTSVAIGEVKRVEDHEEAE